MTYVVYSERMTLESHSHEKSRGQMPGGARHIERVQRTTDGRLFVFLEVIIDKAEDEG